MINSHMQALVELLRQFCPSDRGSNETRLMKRLKIAGRCTEPRFERSVENNPWNIRAVIAMHYAYRV